MNKAEIINHIASEADISKAEAARSLDAIIGIIKVTLSRGETVTLVGFGSFSVSIRSARSGRNPRTGEIIHIKESKIPKFKPGQMLKDIVN
ncbi:MAG: HU family DNA-binding protein [Bordetella sp.]|nr:MAG: HU family DNA-binding protein [Bordetella sp.]